MQSLVQMSIFIHVITGFSYTSYNLATFMIFFFSISVASQTCVKIALDLWIDASMSNNPGFASPSLSSPTFTPVSYGGWINPRVVTPAASHVPEIVPRLNIKTQHASALPVDPQELISQQRSLLRSQIHALKADLEQMPDDHYKKRALMQLADMNKQLASISVSPAHVHSEFEYDSQRKSGARSGHVSHSTPSSSQMSHHTNPVLPQSSHLIRPQTSHATSAQQQNRQNLPKQPPKQIQPTTSTEPQKPIQNQVQLSMPGGGLSSTPIAWDALPRVPPPVQYAATPTPIEPTVAATRLLVPPHAQQPQQRPPTAHESRAALQRIPDATQYPPAAYASQGAHAPIPRHPSASVLGAQLFPNQAFSNSGHIVVDPALIHSVQIAAERAAVDARGQAIPPAAGSHHLLHHAGADRPSPIVPAPAAELHRATRYPPQAPYTGLHAPFAQQSPTPPGPPAPLPPRRATAPAVTPAIAPAAAPAVAPAPAAAPAAAPAVAPAPAAAAAVAARVAAQMSAPPTQMSVPVTQKSVPAAHRPQTPLSPAEPLAAPRRPVMDSPVPSQPSLRAQAAARAEDSVAVLSSEEYADARPVRRQRNSRNVSSLVPHPSGTGMVANRAHAAPVDVVYDHIMRNQGHTPVSDPHREDSDSDSALPCSHTRGIDLTGAAPGLGVRAGTTSQEYGAVYAARHAAAAEAAARYEMTVPSVPEPVQVEDRTRYGLNAHQTAAAMAQRELEQLRRERPEQKFEYLQKRAVSARSTRDVSSTFSTTP